MKFIQYKQQTLPKESKARVKGYSHWALMDNFEWGKKYGEQCYGVYYVERATQKRTLKPGAKWLKNLYTRTFNPTAPAA